MRASSFHSKTKGPNLELARTLEAEKTTRLDLEQSLAPRTFVIKFGPDKTNFENLKPYAGTQVIIETIPEREPIRTASGIESLMNFAGWKVIRATPAITTNDDPVFDGVTVLSYAGPLPETDLSQDAAEELVDWLKENNVVAKGFPAKRGSLPPNTIKIIVGLKPDPYFTNKFQSEATQQIFNEKDREIFKKGQDALKEVEEYRREERRKRRPH